MNGETKTIRGSDVAQALRVRGIRQAEFARLVGMDLSVLSSVLTGGANLNEDRRDRIERGIAELRLGEEAPLRDGEPIFQVRSE